MGCYAVASALRLLIFRIINFNHTNKQLAHSSIIITQANHEKVVDS